MSTTLSFVEGNSDEAFSWATVGLAALCLVCFFLFLIMDATQRAFELDNNNLVVKTYNLNRISPLIDATAAFSAYIDVRSPVRTVCSRLLSVVSFVLVALGPFGLIPSVAAMWRFTKAEARHTARMKRSPVIRRT